jgi:hypothetical protein
MKAPSSGFGRSVSNMNALIPTPDVGANYIIAIVKTKLLKNQEKKMIALPPAL